MSDLVLPHGGKLVERLIQGSEREALLHQAQSLPSLVLNEWVLSDIEMLGIGAFSPLEGFLREADYDSVIDRMRLTNGVVWPIPVTLAVTEGQADSWKEEVDLALRSPEGEIIAVLHQPTLFPYNRMVESKLVYGTTDVSHPGVARVMAQGPYYVGGRVSVLNLPRHPAFLTCRRTPAQIRQEFHLRGWKQVVGFQTRNPIHRAHEYLLRCALEIVDGLLIHPLVGQTKGDDIPASTRMRCYEALIEGYLPKDRVLLVVNPASMRYAGPREAVFHAIIRQNYGCSHFIVGRDHAGVGKFYGPFDAQRIFERFSKEELGITPLCFDNAFYCRVCQGMATVKTCPHPAAERISLSGTAVRQMLSEGKSPPPEFTRPEIAEILKEVHSQASQVHAGS
ncbi:MAG: sulfate adenylyltransferase [Candidatus Omnitrophica bacterium]|nr:sulfate adenylyltransferase [Candidatus Omnitrophota bacterium]